jgi:hypothetical protein
MDHPDGDWDDARPVGHSAHERLHGEFSVKVGDLVRTETRGTIEIKYLRLACHIERLELLLN